MKPILYKANETDFTTLGLGVLADELQTLVTEERNGQFYLEMKYPIDGIQFKELKNDRVIKAHASNDLKNQRFKIIRITKPAKGVVKVYAEHVSNHTADLPLKPNVAYSGSASSALNVWASNIVDDHPFTVYSDVATTGSGKWTLEEVKNARQALGGVSGSILDTYGGEYRFDNYRISLLKQRGNDNGLPIMYGKNLIDLEQEEEIASTYTSIFPYSIYTPEREEGQEGEIEPVQVTLPEYFIDSEHVDKYARRKILKVDFSSDEIETVEDLRSRTQRYITENDVGVPKVNLRVKFIDLAKTLDYKDTAIIEAINLCDWVVVYFEKLGIQQRAKVIKTVWNVGLDRYEEIEIGETRASLTQSIDRVVDGRIEKVETQVNEIRASANGKNRNHWGPNEPLKEDSQVGDTWFRPIGNGEEEIYRYDGYMWVFVLSTADTTKNAREIEAVIEQAETDRAELEEEIGNSLLSAKAYAEAEDAHIRGELESEIGGAITIAEQAKQDAVTKANQALEDAKAHADEEVERIDTALSTEIGGAIELAEEAKADAVTKANQAYEDAVTEADRLAAIRDDGITIEAGQITAGVIDAARLDAVSIVTSGLAANVIKSNHIETSAATIDKLFADDAMIDRLTSKTAFINNIKAVEIDASKITSGTINTARLNATDIVTQGLTTNVIKSQHIETSTATIDKLFANETMINRLTSKTAFINSIKAVEIDASKITSGTINTARLNASDIVTKGLTADVIKAKHISANTALFDKLFTSTLATDRLSAQSAWIKNGMFANASIDGAKIQDATIGSAKIESLDVSKISGNTTNFVRSAWNAINSNLSIDGTSLKVTTSNSWDMHLGNAGVTFTGKTGTLTGSLRATRSADGDPEGTFVIAERGYLAGLGRRLSNGNLRSSLHVIGDTGSISVNSDIGSNYEIRAPEFHIGAYNRLVRYVGSNALTTAAFEHRASTGRDYDYNTDRIWLVRSTDTMTMYANINMNGNTITNQSDIRMKKNITDSEVNALKEIERLKFVNFEWDETKGQDLKPKGVQFGIIAQHSPFLQMKTDDEESYLSVDMNKQVNLNSKASQELLAYTRSLEKRIEVLEGGGQ